MAGGVEIFRAFGRLALEEDGDIRGRLNEVGRASTSTNTTFRALTTTLGAVGVAAVGAATALSGLVIGGLVVATKNADDFKDTLADLASDTNTTGKEMKGLENTLKSVYSGGYGKTFSDTADAIKSVKQETASSGKELEGYTKKLITLSDKMGSDYNETMKTAKVLSKDFGISIDDAFEMMAQGQSKGLNSSGEMLDILSEYSVQFAKNGGSAEEFFNTLISGNQKGVYSYDKLADMQKEFNIRAIDGSKQTIDAYNSLGLSYDDFSSKLAKGGEIGAKAQQDILEALLNVEDPLERNRLGVALMGTQYEDLGDKAVEALADTSTNIDLTKQKMEELNQLRFNSLGEQFDLIKRSLETNIILPIGEFVLPIVQNVVTKFGELFESFRTSPIEDFREKLASMFPEGFKPLVYAIVDGFTSFKSKLADLKVFIEESAVPALGYLVSGEGLEKVKGASDSTREKLESIRKKLLEIKEFIYKTVVPSLVYLATGEGLDKVADHGTDLKNNLEELRGKMVSLKNYITNTLVPALVYLATGEGLGKVQGASKDTKEDLKNLRKTIEDVIDAVEDFDVADMVQAFSDIIKEVNKTIKVLQDVYGWINTIYNMNPGVAISKKIGEAAQSIAGRATGIRNNPRGELSWVGERGMELMYVPKGADIYTHNETRNILDGLSKGQSNNYSTISNVSGGNTYNVTLQVNPESIDSFMKIVNLFNNIENEKITRYSY